jgi:hypothetical protein
MAPSTSPPAAGTTSNRAFDEHDASVYADYLRDLRQELLEPPEFVLRAEPLQSVGPRRGRVIWDGVAVWLD